MWIRDKKNPNQGWKKVGSGINIPDPQHWSYITTHHGNLTSRHHNTYSVNLLELSITVYPVLIFAILIMFHGNPRSCLCNKYEQSCFESHINLSLEIFMYGMYKLKRTVL
jgi:hypothetical protein